LHFCIDLGLLGSWFLCLQLGTRYKDSVIALAMLLIPALAVVKGLYRDDSLLPYRYAVTGCATVRCRLKSGKALAAGEQSVSAWVIRNTSCGQSTQRR
jgi:hypothetical protein